MEKFWPYTGAIVTEAFVARVRQHGAYLADEADAALAAKDAEIERLRGVVHKVSKTRDTLHAERDSLKRQLAEARKEIAKKDDAFTRTANNLTNQLAEARRALEKAAYDFIEDDAELSEAVKESVDPVDFLLTRWTSIAAKLRALDASDLSHRLREMAAQAREEGA